MTMTRWSLAAAALFLVLTAAPIAGQAESLVGGADAGAPAGTPTNDPTASAAAAHRKAEHARITRERAALAAGRQRDEAACYKRFAVEDCLRGVRAKVRDVESALRSQEVELNDAERREKAAERLRAIEEKQNAVPTPPPGGKKGDAKVRKGQPGPDDVKTQHDHAAQQRAQQQRERAQSQATEQASRAASNAERAAKTRERHAEALKAAQERRARVEKASADAAAQGLKPAAPLPAPDFQR
jgi:hypothetical protein